MPACRYATCGSEPFGPEQRKGLWLYHVLEPETWARMCERVSGAASGALYANESGAYFALRKRITKPPHHTWRSYAMFLLDVMPERTAEHYRNKIAVYLRWYQTRASRMTSRMNRRMTWGAGISRLGDVSVRHS